MLKLKKIKLKGFRGILAEKELDLTDQAGAPTSFSLYGTNSTGKTSFVDALEWLLSSDSKINWLQREDAKAKAYPHQNATAGQSFVELTFSDSEGRTTTLRKTFDEAHPNSPVLSSEDDFNHLYSTFVIKPYLRYMEVIDFVYNQTGSNKYRLLADWMGFEEELEFQEKIVLKVLPGITKAGELLDIKALQLNTAINAVISGIQAPPNTRSASESDVVAFVNKVLAANAQQAVFAANEVEDAADKISVGSVTSETTKKLVALSNTKTGLELVTFNPTIGEHWRAFAADTVTFLKEKDVISKLNSISLYERAAQVVGVGDGDACPCPVCGTSWERTKLGEHIRSELATLSELRERKKKLEGHLDGLLAEIRQELTNLQLVKDSHYKSAKTLVMGATEDKLVTYLKLMGDAQTAGLKGLGMVGGIDIPADTYRELTTERDALIAKIKDAIQAIRPSDEDARRAKDSATLKVLGTNWKLLEEVTRERTFFVEESVKVMTVCQKLTDAIQAGVTSRFTSISSDIGKYFGILRPDKKITDIEIVLKTESTGRAAGRSAEIQLSYFDVQVKPAYKVLSESLLNSLGLAIYLACVKRFNSEARFIVLDDIMNSLDISHRDTILQLIRTEFSDYQIVLLTHDGYWFDRVHREFPSWNFKKILSWSYAGGPLIDIAPETLAEVQTILGDETQAVDAARKLTLYVEGRLSELCESIEAKVRFNYSGKKPPTMSELLDGLGGQLKQLNKGVTIHPAFTALNEIKLSEPVMRNFVSHARTNTPAGLSAEEVRLALTRWMTFEKQVVCETCHTDIRKIANRDNAFECEQGELRLVRMTPPATME
ncbi:MAG: AAA family ATPase [Patescibacteria group bacterium]